MTVFIFFMYRINLSNNTLECVTINQDGSTTVETVCGAIKIVKKSKDASKKIKSYIFSYFDQSDDETYEFRCTLDDLVAKDISKTFTKNGIEVQSCYHKEISEYLQQEALGRKVDCIGVQRAGFNDTFTDFYTTEAISLNGNDYEIDQTGRFANFLEPHGSKEEYDAMLKNYVATDVKYQLALICGFAAPVTAIYANHGGDTILVGFTGTTSKGKTISSQLMVSPLANPQFNPNEGFAITAKSTRLGMNLILGDNWGIPAVIDDISALYKASTEDLIYDLASGTCKTRATVDYTVGDTKTWKTLIMLNSEESIIQVGAKGGTEVRLLNINVDVLDENGKSVQENAINAEAIKETVIKNYGFYAKDIIKKIGQIGQDEIMNGIDLWRQDAYNKLKEKHHVDDKSMRVLKKYGVIGYTARLVKEILKDVIDIDIEKIDEVLIHSEYLNYEDRNIAQAVYKGLRKYIKKNSELFHETSSYNEGVQKGYFGIIHPSFFAILEDEFDNFLKHYGMLERKDFIIDSLIEADLLLMDNTHKKFRITFDGNPVRRFYKFVVEE